MNQEVRLPILPTVTVEQINATKARMEELFGSRGYGLWDERGGIKVVLNKERIPRLTAVLQCSISDHKLPTAVRWLQIRDTGNVYHIFTRHPEKMVDAFVEALGYNVPTPPLP